MSRNSQYSGWNSWFWPGSASVQRHTIHETPEDSDLVVCVAAPGRHRGPPLVRLHQILYPLGAASTAKALPAFQVRLLWQRRSLSRTLVSPTFLRNHSLFQSSLHLLICAANFEVSL